MTKGNVSVARGSKRKSFNWIHFVLGVVITFIALHFGLPPILQPAIQLALCVAGALVVGLLSGLYGDTVWEVVVHLL